MDMMLGMDSFMSHIAGTLNIPSVIFYTTLPPEWRNKYYEKSIGIQSPIECSPCIECQFGITAECMNAKTVKPCILAITPEIVKGKICECMEEYNIR